MQKDKRELEWQPPPLHTALPRLHSLVLGNRTSWQMLPDALRLGYLEDLDLQVLITYTCSICTWHH